jgi:trimeric autotransporter adhesin
MNQNILIGILVILVLLGGGYFLLTMNSGTSGTNATSTTTVIDNTNTGTNSGTSGSTGNNTASTPSVITDTSVAPTNSTAVVTGKVTPNGAQTTYWYEYGETSALGQTTKTQSIGSGFNPIPSPGYITGLRTDTSYFFRLSAQNAYGTVNGQTYSFKTNNNPPGQGTAPSATTGGSSNITRTSATVSAQVNPHSSPTTYWFEYGNSVNFGQTSSFQSAGDNNASNALSVSLSGLDPQTKYYFRVNAQNQYGTVNGATQSFTTSGPAATAAPSADTTAASRVASTSVTLNGVVKPNGLATSYWFEYSQDSLLGSIIGTVTAQQPVGASASSLAVSANASSLSRNTKYFYRLVAENSSGTTRGNIVSFTTNR